MGSVVFKTIRYVLGLELVLGGQCRLTDRVTPNVSRKAYAKAEGYKQYLPLIPGATATQHTRNIGILMLAAGALLVVPSSKSEVRVVGAGLGGSLALMGVYAQRRMGVPFWLPVINSFLAGTIVYSEYYLLSTR